MNDLRTAAQQALEALYQAREFTELYDTEHAAAVNERCHENIAALRAALAQKEEPQRAEAQRDALLEALKYLDKEFRQHGRQHWPEAVRVRTAIKTVKEGK